MSVSFIGRTDWRAVTNPEWSVDSWEVDHARVTWRGRVTAREEFEKTLERWAPMPNFSAMRLASWTSADISPSFPAVELHYTGFRFGRPPEVKAVDGESLQSAQGSGSYLIDGESVNVSGTITYMASRTSWTWFETQEPAQASRYQTVRNPVDPLTRIFSASIQDESGMRIHSVPYAAFVTVFNSLTRTNMVSDYQREPIIPGQLWACRAEVDYKVL